MIQSLKWAERKFAFDFPLGVFPWIVERLRGTPARSEEIVKNLPPAILTKRIDGKWSIQENIGHLLDTEELHDGRLDDFQQGKKILRPADMENRRTVERDYNKQDIVSILKALRATRSDFVDKLENMDEAMIGRIAHHPRLDVPMRLIDMAYFVAEHDDFHLAVISRIARSLVNK